MSNLTKNHPLLAHLRGGTEEIVDIRDFKIDIKVFTSIDKFLWADIIKLWYNIIS